MGVEAKIIDGKSVARDVLEEVAAEVRLIEKKDKQRPGLCTILVGEDSASAIYVRNKRKRAKMVGIESFHHELPENVPEEHLLELIGQLNNDKHVDGILVQLPLPKHIDKTKIIDAIDPRKDVDGLHPENLGRLLIGKPAISPCTPRGCMRLLDETGVKLRGKNAVVIGRSNIVGRPMAALLLKADTSVAICHRYSKDITDFTKSADIVVVAAGTPGLITGDHIKDGAIVIDVGINRLSNGSIVGDVDVATVLSKASYLTPVPGGVGPMTIAMLMKNTIETYHLCRKD